MKVPKEVFLIVSIDNAPKPNLHLDFIGEPTFRFAFRVRRTRLNRFKYWLFCLIFPFTCEWLEKEKA